MMEVLMKESDMIGHSQKRQNIAAAVICLVAIGINIILNALVTGLGLPLYLDTVGTVVISAMGGFFPGVLVGFATNIIKSFMDPSSMYYGVINVIIAVSAVKIARRGWFQKISGIIAAILLFTLIGGGLGSLIPMFMDGLSFDSESLAALIYSTGHFDAASSHILSSLIADLPDKAITVIMVVMMLRIMPEKYYRIAGFNMWMQEPSAVSETAVTGAEVRRVSLRTKLLLVLIFSLSVVAVSAICIGIRVYHKTIISEHTTLAQGTANLAAKMIEGDRVDEYLESKGETRDYDVTWNLLNDILASSPEISYLYVYRMEDQGPRVVFDFDTEETPADPIGRLLTYDNALTAILPDLLAGREIEPIISKDHYGYLLTAMAPVYDSTKRCVCYAIVDVNMEALIANEKGYLAEMITIFLGFFILICTFVMWLTDYHVIYPLRAITETVDGFSVVGESQETMDEDVRFFRKIDIHTGDELEKLYRSLCQLTSSQSEQMRSIRRLSDSTAKMQDGLIITMADMVENRDSDTGAHIQKTAAYVKIIVEGLKRKGYYAEKITPKFMSDVVRSAPLHDVGKINIPDDILNKPGKLTDEEYGIMKIHTVIGRKIMEKAINTVKGDNYLKEARNMAAYHHERWDGKGYPEKLHGEVIPLSARIMAVADVFDALTSPRVYKPAFPLEKALSIIQEGRGTQFDPKCVDVFMDSLDEVKVILRKYNEEAGYGKQ